MRENCTYGLTRGSGETHNRGEPDSTLPNICQTGCFNADAQQEVWKSIGPVYAGISDAQDVLMPRTLTDERISEANILLVVTIQSRPQNK